MKLVADQSRDLDPKMQQRADGFIVLKGSMGTLAELALVWNLARIDLNHRKPIILLGEGWASVVHSWRKYLAVTEEEAKLLHIVVKPEEAVELLDQLVGSRV
jgi:predicted Rossmann-fold nucleotide-binding protein